jgi:hypothetical protein
MKISTKGKKILLVIYPSKKAFSFQKDLSGNNNEKCWVLILFSNHLSVTDLLMNKYKDRIPLIRELSRTIFHEYIKGNEPLPII